MSILFLLQTGYLTLNNVFYCWNPPALLASALRAASLVSAVPQRHPKLPTCVPRKDQKQQPDPNVPFNGKDLIQVFYMTNNPQSFKGNICRKGCPSLSPLFSAIL